MKINKIILTILLLFNIITVFSQQSVIQGTVKDSTTNEAISFVAVYLKNEKDSVVYYSYTDDNGNFTLPYNGIKTGIFCAEMIGYKKKQKELNFSNHPEGTILPLDIFLIPDFTLLSEVEVIASANRIARKLDRTIINLDEKEIKKANIIYDILKTIPGVVIDEATNSIRFKGSAPEVLVNNMPAEYIYPDLKQINVEDIENIELIDKSSIFGGAGEGGIINIKIKKNKAYKTFGMYIGTDLKYGIIDNVFIPDNFILNLNAKLGKAHIFNNFYLSSYLYKEKSEEIGTIKLENNIFDRKTNKTERWQQTSFIDVFGVMFNLGKINIMIAEGLQYYPNKGESCIFQTTSFESDFQSNIRQNSDSKNFFIMNNSYVKFSLLDYHNQDIEFFIRMTNSIFNKPKIYNYVTNSDIYENQINTISSESVIHKSSWRMNAYFAQFYYLYRISKSSQFNLHGNFTFSKAPVFNNNYYINDVESENLKEISNFKIRQLPVGISFIQRFGRFSIDFTGNYKFQQFMGNFERHINSTDSIIVLNKIFHNVEPSVRLKYNINNTNDLYLGYSCSAEDFNINNFGLTMRNYVPYINKSNSMQWQSGNDNLKLENYHKVYFSYRLTKDKLFVSTEIFYSLTNNGVTQLAIPINTETILNMPENIAFNARTGLDYSFTWSVSDSWAWSISGQGYHSLFKTEALELISNFYNVSQDKIEQKAVGFNFQAVVRYSLKSKIGTNPSIRFWVDYNTKEITFTGYNSQYFNANIAFRTNFFKNKLYMSLGLENFLSPFIHKQTFYDYLNIKTKTNYYSYDTNMRISLSLGLNLFAGDRGTKDIKL